jgi:hypothetical protein
MDSFRNHWGLLCSGYLGCVYSWPGLSGFVHVPGNHGIVSGSRYIGSLELSATHGRSAATREFAECWDGVLVSHSCLFYASFDTL